MAKICAPHSNNIAPIVLDCGVVKELDRTRTADYSLNCFWLQNQLDVGGGLCCAMLRCCTIEFVYRNGMVSLIFVQQKTSRSCTSGRKRGKGGDARSANQQWERVEMCRCTSAFFPVRWTQVAFVELTSMARYTERAYE